MENMIYNLNKIGVDTDFVINRLGGNQKIYITICKKFLQDTNFQHIQRDLLEKDYKSAKVHVHTLKGVAADLGFKHLELLCTTLMKLLLCNNSSKLNQAMSGISNDSSKLNQAMGEFSNDSSKLNQAMGEFSNDSSKLNQAMGEFSNDSSKLNHAISEFSNGWSKLNQAIGELSNDSYELNQVVGKLSNDSYELNQVVGELSNEYERIVLAININS